MSHRMSRALLRRCGQGEAIRAEGEAGDRADIARKRLRLAGIQVLEYHTPVRHIRQGLAIWADRVDLRERATYRFRVKAQALTGRQVPEHDPLPWVRRREDLTAGAEEHVGHGEALAGDRGTHPAGRWIPDGQGAVRIDRDQAATVRGKCQGLRPACQRRQPLSAGYIPQGDSILGHRQQTPIRAEGEVIGCATVERQCLQLVACSGVP